jgi:hypothetical protein
LTAVTPADHLPTPGTGGPNKETNEMTNKKTNTENVVIPEMSIEVARRIIAETDFSSWLLAEKSVVIEEDNLFRAAFSVVAKFEMANNKKADGYSEALIEYNKKFEWLDEYRKGLKELDAKFGGAGLSDEMETAKNRRNSTAKVIADAAWGSKNIPTMNNDGSARKPKNG